MLQIEIIDNNKGGREDLIFSVDGLFDSLTPGTYYFMIQIEPYEDIQDIRNALATLLNYWLTEIQDAKQELKIFLPIDFSDQYTGCLEVIKTDQNLKLRYAFSERGGYTINPTKPGDFSKPVTDFEDTANKTLEVYKAEFLTSIKNQIEKLTNVS